MAVAVVVGPRCTRAESATANSSLLGDIFELAIAEVTVQNVAAIAGDVEVQQAIVVEIGYRYAHSPSALGEASCGGNVLEGSVRLLMIERNERVAALAVSVDGGAIDRDDIQLTVIVAIK